MCIWIFEHADLLTRKAQASILAVDERQSYEALSRDEKTSSRTLTQLKEKKEALSTRGEKLQEEDATHKERRKDVRGSYILAAHNSKAARSSLRRKSNN